jgi:hypothetical protein
MRWRIPPVELFGSVSCQPPDVSGLWDNRNMRKGLKALAYLLIGISVVVFSVGPAQAQTKADLKAIKECDAVTKKYSTETYDSVGALIRSLDQESQSQAQMELTYEITPKILINCKKLNQKSWKLIKSDYQKAIENAAKELKRIQLKYKENKQINLICIKDGVNQKITGVNPKCPDGFTELYRE